MSSVQTSQTRAGRWDARPAGDAPDDLIVFDGVCVMCSAWVDFMLKRDVERRFRFTSIQSDLGRSLAQRFGVDPEAPQTNIVITDGRAHFMSDAALAAASRLPGWGWTRVAGGVAKPVRDWLYRRIARNRYRLFGRRDVCAPPPAEHRHRFLT